MKAEGKYYRVALCSRPRMVHREHVQGVCVRTEVIGPLVGYEGDCALGEKENAERLEFSKGVGDGLVDLLQREPGVLQNPGIVEVGGGGCPVIVGDHGERIRSNFLNEVLVPRCLEL